MEENSIGNGTNVLTDTILLDVYDTKIHLVVFWNEMYLHSEARIMLQCLTTIQQSRFIIVIYYTFATNAEINLN